MQAQVSSLQQCGFLGALYIHSRMAFLMADADKDWYNMSPDARWRRSKGAAPFKVQKSPILEVPGLSDASAALIDAAHTWHMGHLCCRLPGFMSCIHVRKRSCQLLAFC